jgi:hypothetical protein
VVVVQVSLSSVLRGEHAHQHLCEIDASIKINI